ncbi:MAG: glutamate--tRNA ligase [Actinobacteria bacterium HGW-Actinobacteria-10]|nr:MAG: glutamate--tRNA ligase [Actinobacteria bacterium HGW-Actinobacteria-10]
MTDTVRVRFAPSPTGHLHIGGARTAIYNWAFARHHGGSFVLRIDDTDKERSTEENTQQILRSMRWLGLDWDEGPDKDGGHGPYYQTQRSAFYTEALENLKASGGAYPCFCSPEQLEAKREQARIAGGFSGYDRTCRSLSADETERRIAAGEPHVWRVKVPEDRADITVDDIIRGTVTWPIEAMDDFILARTDGSPTYMFATVVDDWKMGITHIIRGDDHLSNTPRQIVVYEALGAEVPLFAHMGLIHGADGKRLSKRHGATSVEAYAELGYLPEAVLNYLAILGWSLEELTVFSRETFVERFELSRVSKNPAVWDQEKLEWMNGVHIREMTPTQLVDRMAPWLIEAGLTTAQAIEANRGWYESLAPLVSERLKVMSELVPWVEFLFTEFVEIPEEIAAKTLAKEGAGRSLAAAFEALNALPSWEHNAIEETLRAIPTDIGIKPKIVFQAIRVAVTGTPVSPPLFESLELLGKDPTLDRINAARAFAID